MIKKCLLASLLFSALAFSNEDETLTAAQLCEEPRPQVCTMEFNPVCATFKEGGQQSFSNGCSACADISVLSYEPGSCMQGFQHGNDKP